MVDKCNHLNKSIKFHRKGKLVSGKFMGINKNGEALIKTNKKLSIYLAGHIYMILLIDIGNTNTVLGVYDKMNTCIQVELIVNLSLKLN